MCSCVWLAHMYSCEIWVLCVHIHVYKCTCDLCVHMCAHVCVLYGLWRYVHMCTFMCGLWVHTCIVCLCVVCGGVHVCSYMHV